MSRIKDIWEKGLYLVLGSLVSPIGRDGLDESNKHRNDRDQ